jgi:hypothetical protein
MDINGNYVNQDLGESTKKWKDIYLSGVANIANIKIDGNTIESTDTDGDINITPNGDGELNVITNGDINLNSGTARTKITRLLGDTGAEQSLSRSTNGTTTANITATKDVFLLIYKMISNNNSGLSRVSTLNVYSDSSSPSTTKLGGYIYKNGDTNTTVDTNIGFFVKKGNTYTISVTNDNNSLTTTVYWREQEIGV